VNHAFVTITSLQGDTAAHVWVVPDWFVQKYDGQFKPGNGGTFALPGAMHRWSMRGSNRRHVIECALAEALVAKRLTESA